MSHVLEPDVLIFHQSKAFRKVLAALLVEMQYSEISISRFLCVVYYFHHLLTSYIRKWSLHSQGFSAALNIPMLCLLTLHFKVPNFYISSFLKLQYLRIPDTFAKLLMPAYLGLSQYSSHQWKPYSQAAACEHAQNVLCIMHCWRSISHPRETLPHSLTSDRPQTESDTKDKPISSSRQFNALIKL